MDKLQPRAVRPGPDISRLITIRRTAPHIDICLFGWPSDGAQVRVSLASHRGAVVVGTYADDDAGNTQASLAASSLAHITSLRVVDRRPAGTNEARCSLLAHADPVWLPRERVIGYPGSGR